MGDIKLNSSDYLAITRAMDTNKNNRLDASEASISRSANVMIGNANGVAGTKETATSLEQGEVFISKFNRDAANDIAIYFSDRGSNEGKQVKDWKSDGWVSKEDLTMSDALRKRIDTNGDNRISRTEFADALVEGKITIGRDAGQSSVPAQQPAQPPSSSSDPFSKPKPAPIPATGGLGNDPFSKPVAPRPATSNSTSDPFARPTSAPASNSHTSDPFAKPAAAKPSNGVSNDPFGQSQPAKPASPKNDPFSSPF